MKSIMEEASSLAKAFAQAWERAGKPQECTVKILAEPEKNFIGMTTKSAKIAIFFNEPAPQQQKKTTSQPVKRTPVQQPQVQKPRAQEPIQRPERVVQETPKRVVETRATEPRQEQKPRPRVQQAPRENVVREQAPHENVQHENITREHAPREHAPRENAPRENVSLNETSTTPDVAKAPAAPRVRPTWTEEMTQGARTWVQESLQIMGCPDVAFTATMSRSILTIAFTKPLIEDFEKERLLFRSWSHLIVQHIKQEFQVHGKELKIILKGSRV